jgi:iron-sulfur cluster repair protein YtfE (RIC family)
VLCYLSDYAEDEASFIFNQLHSQESQMVDTLLKEYEKIEAEMDSIVRMSNELKQIKDPEARIAKGAELNRMVNRLFAYYITHMNKEEVTIQPRQPEISH